jgi:hypothetical protein
MSKGVRDSAILISWPRCAVLMLPFPSAADVFTDTGISDALSKTAGGDGTRAAILRKNHPLLI